jgi:hypothetical protein
MRLVSRRWGIAVLALAFPAFGGAPDAGPKDAGPKTLAPGDPPLTTEMMGKDIEFWEWVFDTQFTAAQKKTVEDYILTAWKTPDAKAQRGVLDTLRNHEDMSKMSTDERDMIRTQVQPQMIQELKRDKDPIGKLMLGLYENVQKALVPGKPPLTKQTVDAYQELIAFAIGQVSGDPFEPDAAFNEGVAKAVPGEWRKLKAEEKEALRSAPRLWAATREAWPLLSQADKAKTLKDWGEALAPWVPKDGGKAPKKPAGDAGAPVGESEAARWTRSLLASKHVVNLRLLDQIAKSGWKYEAQHWTP